FLITAFSRLGVMLKEAIPNSLKYAITVGLGFFLILIGLEKSGLVVRGKHTFIAIGDFTLPEFIVGILTLFLALFLFIKYIQAIFLLSFIFVMFFTYIFLLFFF